MTAASLPAEESALRARGRPVGFGDRFTRVFALVLGGYALGSKGFAYLGYSPVFVGELTLLAGLVAVARARRPLVFLSSRVCQLLLVFMAFGAGRTLPFLGSYGALALRDAALWGYGLFALVTASLILNKPKRLNYLLDQYRKFIPIFLIGAPLLWPAALLFSKILPKWPGTGVSVLYVKAADFLVHLSGIAAFLIMGLAGIPALWMIVLLTVSVGLAGFQSRGGLLAFFSAFLIACFSRPRSRSAWTLVAITGSVVILLAVSGLRVKFPGLDREISFQQFAEHVASTTGSSSATDLENTKEWRLAWWATIVSYTFLGDYRWLGKGYGINLADDDGFQVADDGSLRSPHSVHMTVLARSGVVGLVLWILLQVTWGITIWRARRHARQMKEAAWAALFAFLFAYWLALLVNGSFDVYLEGPTGGIWFWTVFGAGAAAAQIYRSGANVESAATALSSAADQNHVPLEMLSRPQETPTDAPAR